MTAKDIQKALENKYGTTSKFVVSNVYFFDHPYCETDCLIIQQNGYMYDIEIKISRADFFADFKKIAKHSILSKGAYFEKYNKSVLIEGKRKMIPAGQPIPHNRPNRFYYCVPEGLIKENEVPKYAGLMYVTSSGDIKKIKEAPMLSKEKLSYESKLVNKFYYAYMELKAFKEDNRISQLHSQIRALEKQKSPFN